MQRTKPVNPFFSGTEPFIGYEYDTARILDSLIGNAGSTQCWSIVGQRFIGKTAFVKHLAQPTTPARFGFDGSRCRFIYFDCAKKRLALQSTTTLFQAMCACLVESLSAEERRELDSYNPHTPLRNSWIDEWERLFRATIKQNEVIIWIFDAFETAIRQEQLLQEGAFGFIRSSAQESQFAWLTCTNRSLYKLYEEAFAEYHISPALQKAASDFFGGVAECPLKLLHDQTFAQDLEAMIGGPLAASGIQFDQTIYAAIQRFGGRFPYFLQVAAYHFFEAQLRGTVQIPQVLRRCRDEVKPFWDRYWLKLTQPEQAQLLAIAKNESNTYKNREVGELEYQALIFEHHGRYEPFSEEFRDFLLVQFQQDRELSRSQPAGATESELALSSSKTVLERQARRLEAYRDTLAHYLDQVAKVGSTNLKPEVSHGIRESRQGIALVKATLLKLGFTPDDHPDDNEEG